MVDKPLLSKAPPVVARIWGDVSSQSLLTPGNAIVDTPGTFDTIPFFQVSRPQRLSPLASIPAIRRITDADSVTVFAKLYLFSS